MARALHLSPAAFSVILFSALVIAALVVGIVLNRLFHTSAKKLANTWGELLFLLLETLTLPLLILGALYTALESLTLPPPYEQLGSKLIRVLVILVIFYFPAKVLILFLRRMGQRDPSLERVAQPAVFITRALFALLAVIIILENLEIHLTAVWTTLGIGSVAVALALQETLTNFFAGLSILADRPIRPGDYIKLVSGPEGFVVRLEWRSTILRTPQNNVVVIPNATLAKSVIINYSMPEPWMTVAIQVSVAYGTDPRRVEQILTEIAEEAVREGLEGMATNPRPAAHLVPGFGNSSLDFSLVVHVKEIGYQDTVQSELRKRILERFGKEGIEMPFPTRALVLDQSVMSLLERREPGS
jgi:small-conductance mechanosensitive channel